MLFRKHPQESSAKEEALIVRDASGRILAECPIEDFPFEEKGIIQSSIEFYRDPEPCEIHRGAVLSRSVAHFRMVCPKGEPVAVSALDPLLQALLPPQAATAELR